jgi:hypothetical protein
MRKRFGGGFVVRPTPHHDGRYVVCRKRMTVGGPYPTRDAAIDAAWELSFEAANAKIQQARRLAHNAWKQVLRNADDPWPAAA